MVICFFFQAEDGIRDKLVTGVQTCALPISKISSSGTGPGIDGPGVNAGSSVSSQPSAITAAPGTFEHKMEVANFKSDDMMSSPTDTFPKSATEAVGPVEATNPKVGPATSFVTPPAQPSDAVDRFMANHSSTSQPIPIPVKTEPDTIPLAVTLPSPTSDSSPPVGIGGFDPSSPAGQ